MSNPHLLKITPLVEELRQLLQTADQPFLVETMRPLLDGLQRPNGTAGSSSSVWAWVYGTANAEERAHIEAYTGNNDGHLWQYGNSTWKIPPPHEVTLHWQQDWMATNFDDLQRQPPLFGIFFICQDAVPDVLMVLNHIALAAAQLPIAIIVSPLEWQSHGDALHSITPAFLRKESWLQAANASLKNDIEALHTTTILDAVVAVQAGTELERATRIFQQILLQCEFELKIRRQQIQQDTNLAQKNLSPASGGTSPFMEFKNKFQQRVDQFEKRQAEQLEEQLVTGRGLLALSLENPAEKLGELEERKAAKNIIFSIPEPFRQQMLDNFLTEARRFCNEAVAASRLFMRSLDETVQSFLDERNLHLSIPGASLQDGERIEQILRQAARFERNFEATAMKKKPMEMMMGARMYFMLLMMGASMFGVAQYLRKQQEFYLPLIVVLLGLGVWQFLVLKQKEEQENKEKHQATAKEYLKGESRRILQEFSRLWERANAGAMKEWSSTILREVEGIIQSAEQGGRGQKEAENNRLKSILSTLQNQERNIEGIMRSKTMFEGKLSRTKSELSAALKAQLLKFRLPVVSVNTTSNGGEGEVTNKRNLVG